METRIRYVAVGLFTLVVGAAAIFISLWLQGGGRFGERREIEIKFEGPATGLGTGADVDFNGLRVGEVTGIAFDPESPNGVEVRISIDRRTPVSPTTKVALGTQGLMGSTYVALSGGTAGAPLVAPAGQAVPVLVAPAATSLTEDAQVTLAQIRALIGDNAKPLHEIIANLQTFSGTLAGNTNRIDKILAGLEQMTGGGEKPPPIPTFDLAAPEVGDVLAKAPQAQLVIVDPTSVVALDTQRFLSLKPDHQLVLQKAQWSDTIPKLVQQKLQKTFENAHYRFASLPADGLNADYQLLLKIGKFEIDEDGGLAAEVELDAQLMDHDGKVVGTRIFEGRAPAPAADGAAAAEAMTRAFGAAAKDLLAWYGQTIGHASP